MKNDKLQLKKKKYAAFCDDMEDTPIFFFPWFLDGVAHQGVWDVVLLEENNQVVAALPYFVKKRLGLCYCAMPKFTKYLGPLIKNSKETTISVNKISNQLLAQLPPLAGIELNLPTRFTDWLPFYWNGFQQTTQYTFKIDLSQPWQEKINRNMRRNIRKAEQVLQLSDQYKLEDFYTLNKMSFTRQGLAIPYTFEALKAHDDVLEKNEARKMFFAVDVDNNIHSAAYIIWDKTCVYYHLSGDNPDLRRSGSGIWVLHQAIKYSQEVLGKKHFDFEGSMLERVAAIRKQFGATQTPYHRVWKTTSKRYAFLKWFKRKTNENYRSFF